MERVEADLVSTTTNGRRTAFRTCPLCEATCGLELEIDDATQQIVRVRGDRDHVFSRGFICPKGASFGKVVHDPDRLRRPMVKRDDEWHEVGWDEAIEAARAGITAVQERHGPDGVALYLGNPNVHTMVGAGHLSTFARSLKTRNIFSASTVDQMPKHVSCGLLFGDQFAMPVPDLDRTDYLLMLGANPWESNGSLCTAPDFPGRLKAIQARGGRFVVVDPRRTRTADEADEHIAIRPGTDAFLLFGIVHVLFDEGLVSLGRLAEHVNGLAEVEHLARDFTAERTAAACGIDADVVRRLARELAAAPTAAVYGRMGTCTVEFGTVASWLVDVVNVLTGNLDRPGGAMFPMAAHQRRRDEPGGRGYQTGRWASRVRGLPEANGELPVATLADEIETPGEGQVRALVTVAGNPARSTPNSGRLEAALATLEFMVSVDPYLNETTRHADVILPPTDPARTGHYDFAFTTLSIRNVAVYSPPALPADPDGMDDCEILARLTGVAPDDHRSGEDLLDERLRAGAYDLTLDDLRAAPHGIDLGPLEPRVPLVLRTPSARIELAPAPLVADVDRLRAGLDRARDDHLVLVGRRHVRSNNSWLHNVEVLVKGKDRCTLQVNPADADRLGLVAGGAAKVASRVGSLLAPVEITDIVMPGVVSLPHGWGHGAEGSRMTVAARYPGVNSNALTDELVIDPLSGNAVLNGIPVEVTPA